MYAVIATGGKQERVTEGQVLNVERLTPDNDGDVELRPLLIVDESSVLSAPGDLAKAVVKARVLGEVKGPKIDGFTYKNKSNQRKRWGHRQKYTQVKITSISATGK